MAKSPTSLRLPDDLERRLDRLAELTGRPRAFFIKKALGSELDRLEGVYLPEALRVQERERAAGLAATAKEVGASLGLVGNQLSLA